LLIEAVDRLSRLKEGDWKRLRTEIAAKGVRIVALDLPTSWNMLSPTTGTNDFTSRMFEAVNSMLLDMLAAVARKDYTDRRRRQAEGIAKARLEGAYRGRPEDTERNAAILEMLKACHSWSNIQRATGCSRSTLARLAGRLKAA
jgi:DNA invertase Pin-like site-specific DNA recombinase